MCSSAPPLCPLALTYERVQSHLSLQFVLLQTPTVLLGTAGLVLATVLSTALYGLSVYEQTDNTRTKIRAAMRATGYTDLLLFAVLLLSSFLSSLPR